MSLTDSRASGEFLHKVLPRNVDRFRRRGFNPDG